MKDKTFNRDLFYLYAKFVNVSKIKVIQNLLSQEQAYNCVKSIIAIYIQWFQMCLPDRIRR